MYKELLKDFQEAKRPVLLVGGGARNTRIRELAVWLDIPCIPTWNAVDIITSDFPLYRGRVGTYGGPGRNFAIQNADLLLAIGCRFSGRITGGMPDNFAPKAKKYIVDIDPANTGKYQTVKGDVNITMGAAEFIEGLFDHLVKEPSYPVKWEWLDKTAEWRDKYQPCLHEYYNDKKVNPYVFIKTLSDECGGDDIIVSDCGGNAVVTFQTFETKWGERLISSHGNSTMGFSFAGAIGAQLAAPDRRVICLIGDGGFNMNIQELQTIKNYNLPIKTFIMNNHIYGITRQFQNTHFEGRWLASGPDGYNPPDFMNIVAAYDIKSWRTADPSYLRTFIQRVLAFDEAIVCDVDMGEWCDYSPRVVGWDTPIQDMTPKLSREEYEGNMLW